MQTTRTLQAALVVTWSLLAASPGRCAAAGGDAPLSRPDQQKGPEEISAFKVSGPNGSNQPAGIAETDKVNQLNRNPRNSAAKAEWIAAYRKLDRDGQTRQIEHLLRDRTEQAALVAEGSKAALALQSRHDEIIQRVRDGKKLSDDGLNTLLDDAAAMQHQAVERLARRYRIAVYEAFRTQRYEYERFTEAWRRVEMLWQTAGSPADEQGKLIAWLSESIRRFETGKIGSLPAKPRFGVAAVETAVAARPPVVEAPVTLLSSTPGMKSPLIAPSAKPSMLLPPLKKQPPLANYPSAYPSTTVVAGKPIVEFTEPRGQAAAAKLKSGLPKSQESPDLAIATPGRPDPRGWRADASATVHAVNQPPVLPKEIPERPTPPAPAQRLAMAPRASTLPYQAAPPYQATGPQPATAPPPAPPAPPPVSAPRVAMLPQNPAMPQPLASVEPSVMPRRSFASVEPSVIPHQRVAQPAPPTESLAGNIDLVELQDRVSGYRVAVASLTGHLQDPEPLNSGELTPLIDALDELITRRGDLLLYVKMVVDETGNTHNLDSPLAAVSMLSAKISAARHRIEGRHDDMLITRMHAELTALDQLSRRVAMLAAKLQEQR